MRVFLALVIGILVGASAVWLISTREGRSTMETTSQHIQAATKSARATVEEKLQELDLRPEDIKADLERTGQVVRRKARAAGDALADATADARTTAAIKAKLLASRDLSGLSISVNTTEGIVTLSGSVASPDDIGKAMLVALETEGVREVISTLQVKTIRAAATNSPPQKLNQTSARK